MNDGRYALDSPGFGEMIRAVTPRLERFLDGLGQAPADGTLEQRSAPEFGPPAESPTALEPLLEAVQAAFADAAETAGPRYFGYIPAGGLPSSAVGELISRVVNRFTGVADLASGLVALENSVLRWMTSVFGLPAGAGGLPRSAVRLVPTADGRRLDPAAAESLIEEDRAAGYEPFLLVASAGTTNSGTVDALDTLATLTAEQGLWFHVDGCYGGFFQLTERGHAALAGIERADSISLDPHKSLFLPYGIGTLLVRDAAILAAAHSDEDPADYLQDLADTGLPDYADDSTELTRDHRGLRAWLPLHLHGVGAFRAALDEKLDLARHAHDVLAKRPELEVPEHPDLSTVVFRLRDGGDEANRALFERVSARGRVFWSSTRLDGRFTLRLCILSFRTHREHVDEALDEVIAHIPVR